MICSGKVALVTGGASGIGKSCADEILQNGAKGVVIADVNLNLGEETVKELNEKFGGDKAIFVQTDISDRSSFERAFKKTIEKYENVDILINCAGVLNEVQWEDTIKINLIGTTHGCLLAINDYLPKYKSDEKAYIINIASLASVLPASFAPHYASSKAGVLGLTRSFGANRCVAEQGIFVMAICPGATNTPMIDICDERIIYRDIQKEELKSAYTMSQRALVVAKAVIEALSKAKNGGIWIANENIIKKINFPSLEDMMAQ